MFSSSISLDSDINRYKEELNCDLKIIPTHYIEENPSSRDPDAYLQCMINKHLVGKPEYDFAIIATGSNDISDLETDNSPPTTLFQKASDQSKLLVEVAEALTLSEDIDVLIVEKPPRYDPPTNDSTCMKQKLSRFANGVLSTSTGPTPRLFLVEQAGLARSAGRGRTDLFQPDGVHLTPKGLYFYNSNIVNVLKECYGDTIVNKDYKVNSGNRDKKEGQNNDKRAGGGNDRQSNNGGQREQWPYHPQGGGREPGFNQRGRDPGHNQRGHRNPPPPPWGGYGGDRWRPDMGPGNYWGGYNNRGGDRGRRDY